MRGHFGGDVTGDMAGVKHVRTAISNFAQGRGEGGIFQDMTDRPCLTVSIIKSGCCDGIFF